MMYIIKAVVRKIVQLSSMIGKVLNDLGKYDCLKLSLK